MTDRKCTIQGCSNSGHWQSGICLGCRRYLSRVEKLPLSWRLHRQEVVYMWGSRLDLAVARKGTVTHIRSKRRG